MPDKTFEHVIPFHEIQTPQGSIWLPLVTVTLIQSNGGRVDLPLVFDTGASVTTLRHDLFPLLGLAAWDAGQIGQTHTAGGAAPANYYQYQATFEFLGRVVTCPVNLMELPQNPLWLGLSGRDHFFNHFGFGFWESAHEIYVTLNP